MGDRVSVSFVNGPDESVVLFQHWGGMELPRLAQAYADDLCEQLQATAARTFPPIARLEPRTVMVDFVRWLALRGDLATSFGEELKGRTTSDFYFGRTEDEGDNSDNGHHRIDLPATARRIAGIRERASGKS